MSQAGSAVAYGPIVRLTVGLLLMLLLLMGCTRTGDLGRSQGSSALHGLTADDSDYTASVPKGGYPLTDEERQMRALGDGIFAAGKRMVAAGKIKLAATGDIKATAPGLRREAYATYLVKGPFRSATARYARLIDDTRSDITRLEAFFPVARRVADLDAKREQGLAHVHGLTEAELLAARRRVRENMMLMSEVHRTLAERAEVYRFTLERLVISAPSPMAIDAERTRGDLERRLAAIRVVGSQQH